MKKISLPTLMFILFILGVPLAFGQVTTNFTYHTTPQTLNMTYDALHRVLLKETKDQSFVYTYDTTKGTLTNVTFPSGSVTYTYDDRLRIENETKTINGMTFTVTYTYDANNRILSRAFSSGKSVAYEYNDQGLLERISGFISDIDYNEAQQTLERTYENELTSSYLYDPETFRLTDIQTEDLQDLSYGYDSVGNIISKEDDTSDTTETLGYDALYRLTSAKKTHHSTSLFDFAYQYDALGNLERIDSSQGAQIFLYEGALLHAPSTVVDGTSANQPPTVPSVLSPNGGEAFEQNSSISVRWNESFDPEGNPVMYTLAYSKDSGQTWITLVQDYGSFSTFSDGSSSHDFVFEDGGNQTVYLRIPKHARVAHASIEITGSSS